MKSPDVAHYLLNTPEFFEEHAEMLAQITLPHPHGGRTISLVERQLFALREKNKALERQLRELLEFAKDNDALQHKVHEFTTSLFAARDLFTVQEMVPHLLRDLLSVPHAVLRLWQTHPPGADILKFTDTLTKPVCQQQAAPDTAAWFGEVACQLHSFSYMPLHAGSASIGLLVLASEDRQRFYPEMGTVFLQRIEEAVECALHPYLDHQD
ncbi:MAG: DUF484 family protein [Gallionella sp.]|nr:DUF484 family protein [Gallionella sp.]